MLQMWRQLRYLGRLRGPQEREYLAVFFICRWDEVGVWRNATMEKGRHSGTKGGTGGGSGGGGGGTSVCRICGQGHAAHEPHVYDYAEEVDEDLTCHICLQPFVTPLDIPCGHTFCGVCLNSYLRFQQLCPIDREPLTAQLCSPSNIVLRK
jgi:hypothetical protein